MFKRFITFLFIVSVLAIAPSTLCGNPLLSEIINNTDQEFFICKYENSNGMCEYFNNIKMVSYSMESNLLLAPETVKPMRNNGGLCSVVLKPRTRNILLGLEIPSGGIGMNNRHLFELMLYEDIGSRHPGEVFSFCRVGELMTVMECYHRLGGLYVSQIKIDKSGWRPHVLNYKILDNKHYSILIEKAETPSLRFNIHFKNISAPLIELASFAKAFIGDFQPGTNVDGRVKVMISFERLVTLDFLQKFTYELGKEISIRYGSIEKTDKQPLSLIFSTDITKEEIQHIIDRVNEVISFQFGK